MKLFQLISLVYGLFLIVGAYFGWKAGSTISLLAGLVSGVIVLLGGYVSLTNLPMAVKILLGVSGFLSVTFLIRLLNTHKIMPAGMLLAVSSLVFIMCILQILKK